MKQKYTIDRLNKDADAPKDSSIYITAFTDASFNHQLKTFGVAIWIKNFSGLYTTTLAGLCKSPLEAEQIALQAAQDYILTLDLQDKVIVIQSDCTAALDSFKTVSFYAKGATFVKLKHVKGHTNNKTNRTKVNNWCDTEAKKARLAFETN